MNCSGEDCNDISLGELTQVPSPFLVHEWQPDATRFQMAKEADKRLLFFLSVHTRKSGVVDRQKTARDIWIQVVCFSHTHLQVS